MKIPLIKPYITDEIKHEVLKVLDSGYLTEGAVTNEFEKSVTKYLKCKNTIAVCNCTVGMEISLRALGIRPGDEIIIPDYTYPATASVVEIVGAKIVIVDINPKSMLIDYDAIEKAITQKTKAIIPVSIFGNPLDYDRLNRIKEKYNLYIIEDAACSIGAEYKGEKVGNQADISVFSLHPRKFITTGEGGLVTTNNSKWADWMLSYKHFGMGVHNSRLTTSFDRIGTNYKLSDIVSAIGLVQMNHIDKLLTKRYSIAMRYYKYLSDTPGIDIPETTKNGEHSFQSCCIFVDNRNKIMTELRKKGIESQIGTYSLHMHKAFNDNNNSKIIGKMPGSKYAFKHCLTLPMYHEMTNSDQDYVIKEVKEAIGKYSNS